MPHIISSAYEFKHSFYSQKEISMDTCRLLHNKLHSADQWSGENIASSLSPELCSNIKACYSSLEPQVKNKLLLATLNMPHKMVENASSELQQIFSKAENDTDEWSRVLSGMLKNFPKDGKICTELNDENWQDAIKSITSLLIEPASANLRPLERLYMNTGSSGKIVPTQHFKFSSKHKSASARAELLAKGRELQESKKREQEIRSRDGVSIPQYRGQTTAVPTPAARKPVSNLEYKPSFKPKEEYGIKILDMNEAPRPEPRKRRKVSDRLKSQDSEEPDTPAGDQDATFQDYLNKYNSSFPYFGLDQAPPTPKLDDSYQVNSFAPSQPLFSPSVDYQSSFLDPDTLRSLTSVLEKSNRLIETDQAVIVNFLKGNRVNPNPEKGSTVTILLNSEVETDSEGRNCLVEILFEMNYDTGRWRRLKRQSAYTLNP